MRKLLPIASLLLSGCAGVVYAPQHITLNAKTPTVNVSTSSVSETRPTDDAMTLSAGNVKG